MADASIVALTYAIVSLVAQSATAQNATDVVIVTVAGIAEIVQADAVMGAVTANAMGTVTAIATEKIDEAVKSKEH